MREIDDFDDIALTVDCPVCLVKAEDECIEPLPDSHVLAGSKVMFIRGSSHQERYDAAQAQISADRLTALDGTA